MPALVLIAALALQQQTRTATQVTGPAPTPEAVAADTGALRHTNGRPAPYALAVRLQGAPPRIDGDLGDPVWTLARPVTEFTQRTPHDGEPASERTEVRIVYDAAALYVSARM
jgi:hypothetical protein